MPTTDNERQDESDQIEVEEIEHVADQRGGEDLVLVRRQRRLSLQVLEAFSVLPVAELVFI